MTFLQCGHLHAESFKNVSSEMVSTASEAKITSIVIVLACWKKSAPRIKTYLSAFVTGISFLHAYSDRTFFSGIGF